MIVIVESEKKRSNNIMRLFQLLFDVHRKVCHKDIRFEEKKTIHFVL